MESLDDITFQLADVINKCGGLFNFLSPLENKSFLHDLEISIRGLLGKHKIDLIDIADIYMSRKIVQLIYSKENKKQLQAEIKNGNPYAIIYSDISSPDSKKLAIESPFPRVLPFYVIHSKSMSSDVEEVLHNRTLQNEIHALRFFLAFDKYDNKEKLLQYANQIYKLMDSFDKASDNYKWMLSSAYFRCGETKKAIELRPYKCKLSITHCAIGENFLENMGKDQTVGCLIEQINKAYPTIEISTVVKECIAILPTYTIINNEGNVIHTLDLIYPTAFFNEHIKNLLHYIL